MTKGNYHLSMFAMMATFSVGACSKVAQCDASMRFCFKIGSHVGNGAVVPCKDKNDMITAKLKKNDQIQNFTCKIMSDM